MDINLKINHKRLKENDYLPMANDYDNKRNSRLEVISYRELEPPKQGERIFAQMFETNYRVKNDSLLNCEDKWNNCTFEDIDYKKYLAKHSDAINAKLLYRLVTKHLIDHYSDNFIDAEISRSGTSFHFFFIWDCERTFRNYEYYHLVSSNIIRKTFEDLGYKDIIEYPGVHDNCPNSQVQFVYLTKNDWIHNYKANGRENDYGFDIELKEEREAREREKEKEEDANRSMIDKLFGIGKKTTNSKYDFKIEDIKYKEPEYLEHKGPKSRWMLYDSLFVLYKGDKLKITKMWNNCCRKMPAGPNKHDYYFYMNEPIRNKWYDIAVKENKTYCDTELLSRFGITVSMKKRSIGLNELFAID